MLVSSQQVACARPGDCLVDVPQALALGLDIPYFYGVVTKEAVAIASRRMCQFLHRHARTKHHCFDHNQSGRVQRAIKGYQSQKKTQTQEGLQLVLGSPSWARKAGYFVGT